MFVINLFLKIKMLISLSFSEINEPMTFEDFVLVFFARRLFERSINTSIPYTTHALQYV